MNKQDLDKQADLVSGLQEPQVDVPPAPQETEMPQEMQGTQETQEAQELQETEEPQQAQEQQAPQRTDAPSKSGGIDFQMFAEVSQIAFIMAGGVIVGYFVGAFLDSKLGTAPWLTLVMLLLGLAAGLKSAYDTLNKRR